MYYVDVIHKGLQAVAQALSWKTGGPRIRSRLYYRYVIHIALAIGQAPVRKTGLRLSLQLSYTCRRVIPDIALSQLTREAEMKPHVESERIEEGLNRRGLVQALAAGAAASIATPS